MATLRKITLNWEIRTGAITCDTGYIKRQELCDVDLYVTVDGTPYALDTSWALNLSIKPALLGDNAALVAVTTWTASATTGLYQATAQTIGGTALDTYLAANNADTTDDEGNKLVDLDVYYTVSMAMRAKSDTVTVICKPDVGRTDDTVPATIIARNDFLVSNGTGLLVNVAAGYAANGAFVAAQASLAITNATNYIEVTAAGVASVNTTAFSAGSYPLATVVASAGAITSNTDLRAWITPKPATSTGLTVGTTAIASGTSGRILYDNAGVLGELPVGTGVATALAVNVGSAGAFITFNGDAGTPSALVGTNISGTASGLTAGNVTTIPALSGAITNTGNATVLGSFTMAQLSTAVSDGDPAYVGAANTFSTGQTISSTSSLLLGTAGSAVGDIGFRNATSGTTTLAPATGALGTGTVTLPLSGTLAISSGAQTFTGVQSMTSPDITTSITTPSTTFALVNATATTVNFAGGASTALNVGHASGTNTIIGSSALNGALSTACPARSSGSAAFLTITTPADTTLTASTASPGVNKTAATRQWASGALSNQQEVVLGAPTYSAVSASTFTGATNLFIAEPIAGTNMTLTGPFAATVQSLRINGRTTASGGSGVSKMIISDPDTPARYGALYKMASGINSIGILDATFGTTNWQYSQIASSSYPTYLDGSTVNIRGGGTQAIAVTGANTSMSGTLAVTGASTLTGLLTTNGGITLGDAQNIAFNTTTGTKIGAATTQKLSFWNATPIVQPTTAVASATVVSPGGGTNLKTDDTFDGYTIAQVVKALRNAGLLA